MSKLELPLCLLFILVSYFCAGNLLLSEDQWTKTAGLVIGLAGICVHVYAFRRWPPIPPEHR